MENYNYAVIRELVEAAFDDEGLAIFCYDNFNDVAEQFTAGQTRKARIQLLIDYVKRHGLTNRLLTGIQEANPYQYGNFESGLKSLRPGKLHISLPVLIIPALVILVKKNRKLL